MSNFGFLGYPSTSLSQTSSNSSSQVGSPFGTLNNGNFCHPFTGNSTGVFGTNSSAPSSVSTLSPFGGSVHQSPNQSGLGFSLNATQATPSVNSPFSAQTQNSGVTTAFSAFYSRSNANSPFPSVHSNPFSTQTQSGGVTTAFSPFSSQSNANSPFPSVHSNPFSTQTQSGGVTTAFSPFSSQSNANSLFPSVHSNPFSTQTQNSGVTTAFSAFSSQSNANSPFPSVYSNPFSTQTQSGGVTTTSPFSTQSNANPVFPSANSNPSFSFSTVNPNPVSTQTQSNGVSRFAQFSSHSTNTNYPFPSASSNPFSVQTQSSGGVTAFAPFSSQSNANSYISNSSNPFTPQTPSINSQVNGGFSTNNTSTPFFNSTTKPVIVPSSGSRVAPYASTKGQDGNLLSISSMPVYESKSHEELRFEDQQLCRKDGKSASTEEPEGNFLSVSRMPVYQNKSHEELRFEDLCKKDGQSTTEQAVFPIFKPACTNIFPAVVSPPINTQATFPGFISPVNTQTTFPGFTSPANTQTTFPGFISPVNTQTTIPGFTSPANTQTTFPGFISPVNTQTTFPGFNSPANTQTTFPGFITPVNTQAMPSIPSLLQENVFAPKSTSSAFDLPNSPNIAPPLSPFVPNSSLSPGSTVCSNCKRIETQSSQPTLVAPSTNLSPNQLNPSSGQQTVPQNQSSVGPDAVQVSFNSHPGSVISVQYGISSLSVSDKAPPTRRRSLLIVRHSSLNRTKMLPPRYNPDSNASRVPFFMAGEEKATEGAANTHSVIFPRQNPRSWIRPPTKEFPQSYNSNTLPEMEHTSIHVYENGNVTQADLAKEKQTDTCEAVNYKREIDVDDMMPKLKNDDYYTEPTIQELAEKEREEPGFCRRVQDFVIGRRGFGAIKFTGETDVRGLELDDIIQLNSHEVNVYMDDSKKPEVGKGLNKPAEITLLNLKCINRKTGEEYTDGHLVDRYKNLLIGKCEEQGAEFVSYDPVKGEWKFKVKHF